MSAGKMRDTACTIRDAVFETGHGTGETRHGRRDRRHGRRDMRQARRESKDGKCVAYCAFTPKSFTRSRSRIALSMTER